MSARQDGLRCAGCGLPPVRVAALGVWVPLHGAPLRYVVCARCNQEYLTAADAFLERVELRLARAEGSA